ncbi:hypothetical protein Y88_3085 [Novosphingobium nitrogenifigens DSM 19370]|uniref:Uncharacterized protein n=1 Tax=Novosphingobium nitrogenifigens DSM 19370 TaxID=983920 RepID=F1ZCF9_9SPHN|nr:hypothetical protein [Novosphingobium nitrogenifigens]EGD57759.1 hypothetical protein Y88_3085 [Novosphingobium nitrogenifigens DSM 19370]
MNRLIGGILMAIGILVAGASGICSLTFLWGMARGDSNELLPLVALFGGLPFLSGIVFIAGGTAMLRRERRRDHRDSAKYFE